VVRLATGARGTVRVRTTNGTCVVVDVRECTTYGFGIPPEWLAHCPPWSGVLIVAMMSWSTSWCHCSAVNGEAPGPKGLRRSVHAAFSVPLGPAPGGVMAL
jgi:hypothetical protein